MTEPERYSDPRLARRVREWAHDEAPSAAPERLVFAVMDEVDRLGPRRDGRFGRLGALPRPLRFAPSMAHYVALTLVIAVGVASGILATRSLLPGTTPASTATPSPAASATGAPTSPSGSPGTVPSLPPGVTYPFDALALATEAGSIWVGTGDGTLIQLDAQTGAELKRVALGFPPAALAVVDGAVWAVSEQHDLVRYDPAADSITAVPATAGGRLEASAGALWVGQAGQVAGVDPATARVITTVAVTGHRVADPIAALDGELLVATNVAVVRLDAATGAQLGSIQGDASQLAIVGGVAWIARGTELVGVDLSTGSTRYVSGLPSSADLEVDGARLWTVGPPGAREAELVQVDPASGAIVSRTRLIAAGRAIVASGDFVWVASDEDHTLRRYAAR